MRRLLMNITKSQCPIALANPPSTVGEDHVEEFQMDVDKSPAAFCECVPDLVSNIHPSPYKWFLSGTQDSRDIRPVI